MKPHGLDEVQAGVRQRLTELGTSQTRDDVRDVARLGGLERRDGLEGRADRQQIDQQRLSNVRDLRRWIRTCFIVLYRRSSVSSRGRLRLSQWMANHVASIIHQGEYLMCSIKISKS